MTYTPRLLQEYRECEKALLEAERLLQEENPNVKGILTLENILSVGTDAMTMIRNHREYGQRLPVVLERIAKLRKDSHGLWPSEPGLAPKNSPLIEPVTDAELLSGNWASCVSQAKTKNLEIATARQIAELRMKHGKDSVYCTKGCWVAENFNYMPDGKILVASADYNPHFKYAEEATKAFIAGNEFYLDDKVVAGLLEGVKQGSVLVLKRKDVPDKISTDAFGKESLTAFLGWGKGYGEFLSKNGINAIRLFVDNKQKKAFSRALWADNLNDYSALNGDSYLNYIYGRAFGVRRGEQPEAASRGERSEQSGTGSTGPR